MAAREELRPLICSAWGSDVLARGRSAGALEARSKVHGRLRRFGAPCRAAPVRSPAERAGRGVRWGLDLERFSPGSAAAARRPGPPRTGRSSSDVRGLDRVYNPELLLEAFARVRAATRRALPAQAPAGRPRRGECKARSSGSASATRSRSSAACRPDGMPDVYRRGGRRGLDPVERQLAAQRLGGARVRAAGRRLRPALGARGAAPDGENALLDPAGRRSGRRNDRPRARRPRARRAARRERAHARRRRARPGRVDGADRCPLPPVVG